MYMATISDLFYYYFMKETKEIIREALEDLDNRNISDLMAIRGTGKATIALANVCDGLNHSVIAYSKSNNRHSVVIMALTAALVLVGASQVFFVFQSRQIRSKCYQIALNGSFDKDYKNCLLNNGMGE